MTMHEPVIVQAGLIHFHSEAEGAAPHTTGDLVSEALEAWDAGAAAIHIEVPGSEGDPGTCADRLAPVAEGIRAAGCDAILSLSCRSCGGVGCGEQGFAHLALRPELAVLDCGAAGALHAADKLDAPLVALAESFRAQGTAAELRCADAGQVGTALRLRDAGLIEDPLRFQLFVDPELDEGAAIERLMGLTSLIPDDAVWSARTRGLGQLRMNLLSMLAGGHVTTGLEDSRWLVQDVPATNRELVARVVRMVDELDRPLATPEEARQILHLDAPERDWAGLRDGSPAGGAAAIDLKVASG